MDDLVVQGIENILKNGVRVSAKSKHCMQSYNVSYTLVNPLDRIFTLRLPYSVHYLSRELLAFLKEALKSMMVCLTLLNFGERLLIKMER